VVRDRRIVFAASFLRAVANGLIGVLAGIYLAQLRPRPGGLGAVLGAGIAGTAVGAAGVMFWGDRIGRKRWLVGLGVLAAAGGVAFAFSSQAVVLGAAAFLGMLNSLGKDRAARLRSSRRSCLHRRRCRPNTRLRVVQRDPGRGARPRRGARGASAVAARFRRGGSARFAARRGGPLRGALCRDGDLYLGLSSQAESPTSALRVEVSPQSRSILAKMSFLFALDSFAAASRAVRSSRIFFHAQFGASEAAIGMLFVGARIMNAFSHLGAAWLFRAHRPREYHGVHAHALEPSHLHHPVHRKLRACGRALPPARGALGDGRADAPVYLMAS